MASASSLSRFVDHIEGVPTYYRQGPDRHVLKLHIVQRDLHAAAASPLGHVRPHAGHDVAGSDWAAPVAGRHNLHGPWPHTFAP